MATEGTSRSGFSLAELMIAIVILGLGLLMVATMFPVGWMKARELAEFSTSQSIVGVAEVTVARLCRVEGPDDPDQNLVPWLKFGSGSSFAGDLLGSPINLTIKGLDPNSEAPADTFVHVLNVDNLLADTGAIDLEDSWRLELNNGVYIPGVGGLYDFGADMGYALSGAPPAILGHYPPSRMWYGDTQIQFGERVYPPMPTGATPGSAAWDDALATRRFAWNMLYRLPVAPVIVPPGGAAPLNQALATTRQFTAYYVTLRRTQPTHRFAKQDPGGFPPGTGINIDLALPSGSVILPLPAANDVKFPIAWLVPLEMIASAPGVPGTAEVIPGAGAGVIDQLFPPGAVFIARLSGNIYEVAQREVFPGSSPSARLTLDREILDTLDFPANPGDQILVWVYPPRVERADGLVSFYGPSPVASIDVRTLSITP